MREPSTWLDVFENCRIAFMTSAQVALCFLILTGVFMATVAILLGFAVIVDKALPKMTSAKKAGDE